VRDAGVGGSNPLTPTISYISAISALRGPHAKTPPRHRHLHSPLPVIAQSRAQVIGRSAAAFRVETRFPVKAWRRHGSMQRLRRALANQRSGYVPRRFLL